MSNEDALALAWRNGQIPIINGVTFRGGTCIRMELYSERRNSYIETSIRMIDKEGRVDMRAIGEIGWTYRGEMISIAIPDQAIRIVGGDGSMGADGFIAAVDTKSNEPLWVLFFDDSNPFDSAEVQDETIIAHSTFDCIWRINLKDPTKISISELNRR